MGQKTRTIRAGRRRVAASKSRPIPSLCQVASVLALGTTSALATAPARAEEAPTTSKPAPASALYSEAVSAIAAGDYQHATLLLEHLDQTASLPQVSLLLAKVKLRNGDFVAARSHLERYFAATRVQVPQHGSVYRQLSARRQSRSHFGEAAPSV